MKRAAALSCLVLLLAGCAHTVEPGVDCRQYITPEMLKEPLPTVVMPERTTPQREMFEQYLSDLGDKELNDKDHKALIAALRRCWDEQTKRRAG